MTDLHRVLTAASVSCSVVDMDAKLQFSGKSPKYAGSKKGENSIESLIRYRLRRMEFKDAYNMWRWMPLPPAGEILDRMRTRERWLARAFHGVDLIYMPENAFSNYTR